MKTKIHAGRYAVAARIGQYIVTNQGDRNWVVTNARRKRVGKFPSLAEATAWLESLETVPASVTSKNYLRDLLAQHAGSEVAETERSHFNALRAIGAVISQADVSRAIGRLTRGGVPSIPRQARRPVEPVMPKAEAIRQARAALRQPSLHVVR